MMRADVYTMARERAAQSGQKKNDTSMARKKMVWPRQDRGCAPVHKKIKN
jgi:hypothetical protein